LAIVFQHIVFSKYPAYECASGLHTLFMVAPENYSKQEIAGLSKWIVETCIFIYWYWYHIM